MEELLETIKVEIEAGEISEGSSITNVKETTVNNQPKAKPTTSTFLANEQRNTNSFNIQRAFCNELHYSASCNVTSVDARKEKLKESGRCFVCLSKDHQAKGCTSQMKCRCCHRAHHQSICTQGKDIQEKGESKTTNTCANTRLSNVTTTTAKPSNSTVLLQKARATARNGNLTMQVQILFDTKSQRSYISNSVRSRLKLNPTDKETLHLNTFGNTTFKKQDCEVYNFIMKNKHHEGVSFSNIEMWGGVWFNSF